MLQEQKEGKEMLQSSPRIEQNPNQIQKPQGRHLQHHSQIQSMQFCHQSQNYSKIQQFDKQKDKEEPNVDEVEEDQKEKSSKNMIEQDKVNKDRPVRRRKMKKERKIRTLITKQKLLQMNKIFNEVLNKQKQREELEPKGIQPLQPHRWSHWNLKTIAKHLNLGYSTILHKFRQFRAHKKVKAGALIASMQQKRKYKKSLLVERIIKQAMNQKQFFTASQMTEYIQRKYNQTFSRSIISRHLGQMGYSYKNVSRSGGNKETKYIKIKKMYVEAMKPLIQRGETLIFVDEMSCCINQHEQESQPKTISILIVCTIYGVLFFHLQDGFIDRNKFYDIAKDFLVNLRASPLCQNIQGEKDQIYLVTDASSIHRDINHGSKLATMLIEQNTEIYYIPPGTPEFNPIEPIFQKIRNKLNMKVFRGEIYNYQTMWQCLQKMMEQIKAESTQEYFLSIYEQMQKYLLRGNKK